MARVEKTIFISYRRTDVYTALAVYENLKNQGYDIFFDYRSISSGDFEQIISSNIRARAHFLLILTPTALDRCNEPSDWLRREIEFAMDQQRNIIPLFFRGFRFGVPSIDNMLTGKLGNLSRYNGLNVHEDYFDEAMHRLRTQYLNIPLTTVLQPLPTEVQKVVQAEQNAADQALAQIEDVKELVKQGEAKPPLKRELPKPPAPQTSKGKTPSRASIMPGRMLSIIGIGVLVIGFLIWGATRFFQNLPQITSEPEQIKTSLPTETPFAPPPRPGIGSVMTGKDDMLLVYVPAGEFTMGGYAEDALVDCQKFHSDCQLDWFKNEEPPHSVELDAFWIDQTEVTNKMYSFCVEAGVCREPTDISSYTHPSYYGNTEFDDYPVIYVDWDMAKTYCEWIDRTLPTEAEWEKAARGSDGRIYPWGNMLNCSLANYWAESNGCLGDTTRVGKYQDGASPYGALDMVGNVWEWVADLYDANYYGYAQASNPLGPDSGQDRVLRGGSWSYVDLSVRPAARNHTFPTNATNNLGFRCAMDATP